MPSTEYAPTPTGEPYNTLLTPQQMASIAVRKAACGAEHAGVPIELALAEVRFGYRRTLRP
jgi:hypothetical protein